MFTFDPINMDDAAICDYLCKAIVIGDTETGKSSLLLRFAGETFTQNYMPTIGVDFRIKNLRVYGMEVNAQMWDTPGQERFRDIATSYYRGADGAMAVFSVTDRDSFDKVRDCLQDVKKYASGNIQVLLVGNKADLEHERKVTSQEAKALAVAAENGINYIETSAKTSKNVKLAFVNLIKEVIKKNYSFNTKVLVAKMDAPVKGNLDMSGEQSVATVTVPDQTVPEWGTEIAHALQKVVKKMDAVDRLETVVTNMSKRLEDVESRLARFESRKIDFKTAHAKSSKQ